MDSLEPNHPVTIHRWSAQDSSSSTSDLASHSTSATHLPKANRTEYEGCSETTALQQHISQSQDGLDSSQLKHERSSSSAGSKLPHPNAAHRQWWKPITWMLSFILLAIVFAAAHHGLNASLNTRPISSFSQTWAHNLGNGLAFGVKTCCTLTIALTCQEVLWYSVQQKSIRVSTLDNMFTLLSNPLSFASGAWRSASALTVLAATAWLIPIAAILSPGTLTVGINQQAADKECTVPTYPGNSNASTMFTVYSSTEKVDVPDGELDRLASLVFSSGEIVGPTSPCASNCTYRQIFYAPAVNCSVVPQSLSDDEYAQDRGIFYDGGDATAFNGSNAGKHPMDLPLFYKNKTTPTGPSLASGSKLTFVNCSAYNASYRVDVKYQSGLFTFDPHITFLDPLLWYGLLYTPAIFHDPPTNPRDEGLVSTFAQANGQVLVKALYTWLEGTIWTGPAMNTIFHTTKISQTLLLDLNSTSARIARDLVTAIPELLTNLTLSTMSYGTANQTVTCNEIVNYQSYQYSPLWLVLPYTLAILAAGVAAIVAFIVLQKSGFRTGKIFSQILVTTRNVDLDSMTQGNSLSSVNLALKDRRLRFGQIVLDDKDGPEQEQLAPHAAFGEADRVVALKRNVDYI